MTFEDFLRQIRGLSEQTVRVYSRTVPNNEIVRTIVEKHSGQPDLYNVKNSNTLKKIFKDVRKYEEDTEKHWSLSNGVNAWYEYLFGKRIPLI